MENDGTPKKGNPSYTHTHTHSHTHILTALKNIKNIKKQFEWLKERRVKLHSEDQ
jgi:hypothetical protein